MRQIMSFFCIICPVYRCAVTKPQYPNFLISQSTFIPLKFAIGNVSVVTSKTQKTIF